MWQLKQIFVKPVKPMCSVIEVSHPNIFFSAKMPVYNVLKFY